VARATTPRGAALVIGTTSVAITIAAGAAMTIIDRKNFPSIGSGLWWAVQTVTTVGYGDHVPTTAAGQLVAALVMLFGIGFLTVITASITSTFVARSRAEQFQPDPTTPTAEQVDRLDERLDGLERRLDARLERIEAALTRGDGAP